MTAPETRPSIFEDSHRARSVAVVLLAGLVVAALIGVWLLDMVARSA